MNVFLRLNINVLNYLLIYVRMLRSVRWTCRESCDDHMLVRAKARCFKKLRTEFHVREAASFSDNKVGCRRRIVTDVWIYIVKLLKSILL